MSAAELRAKRDLLHHNYTQRFTLAYMAALALIAVLSISAHILIDRTIVRNEDSAAMINIAGRQRMLSQRIAFLSTQLESAASKKAYMDAIELMSVQNQALTARDGHLGIKVPMTEEIRTLYYDGPSAADIMTLNYIKDARALLDPALENKAEIKARLDFAAINQIIPALDKVVAQLQRESDTTMNIMRTVGNIVLAVLIITLIIEAFFIFRPLVNRIKLYTQRLKEMATTDVLTGLYNRRYFTIEATRLFALAKRTGQDLCLLQLDIDHFKKINDTHGHMGGDTVLADVAAKISSVMRKTDLLGANGGRSFASCVPARQKRTL